ncbi:MAG TPA: VWA domain-containing protein [Candidatus Binatia bacterium]|nr:VWA domain-containing protein [Candidatus Binatia bacterium]
MEREKTTGSRWKIAGALVVATALAGAVARGTVGGGTSRFTAPGGGPVTFTGHLDRTAVLRGHDGLVKLELVIGAKGTATRSRERVPTDLLVILDRSGSMAGEKIDEARAAIRELVSQLGPDDRFALVTYANEATLALPLAPVNDTARAHWLATIGEIRADGGTNIAAGLDVGLDMIDRARTAGRAPRAILISDGLANQGDASRDGLVRRAGRAARGEYVLSAVGVGADFNEYLMTALADAGAGNYYYLQAAQDLGSVFAREFDAARTTVASSLAVRIDPGDGISVVDAAGYPLEHDGGAIVFHPGALFAGQERRIWVTLAVPSHTVADYGLGRFTLAYGDGAEHRTLVLDDLPRVACVKGEDEFYGSVDVPAWTRSVVVDAYNRMQQDVAREVKAGRKDGAEKAIRTFRDETEAANGRLKSAAVGERLQSLDQLEADVGGAFEGADQEARQNELAKSKGAEALDQRRVGSKK